LTSLGIALPMLYFQANLLFSNVNTPSGATGSGRYTLRNISCMMITPCMSVAVSDFGAEWIFWKERVICNVLMACYRWFLYMYQITMAL